VADSPDVPVVAPAVETEQTVVLETQAPVGLGSADIPALTRGRKFEIDST